MILRILAAATALILVLALPLMLAGCSGKSDEMEIRLAGNITTGCSWTYTMSAEGVVEEVKNDYEQDGDYGTDEVPAVGRGGVFVFVFKPVGEGDVTLNFSYSQPWEGVVYRTAVYELHSDGKTVTVLSAEEQEIPVAE